MNELTQTVSAKSNEKKRIALAGNPNTGKTSLFNVITGARQHVGNYPGVTVEKKEGNCTRNGLSFIVSDLPGTYSLFSYSPEEKIAETEILSGKFDAVIVAADSTNLARSLVVLAQIMMTGVPCVLCLNMWDEAEKAGKKLDIAQMTALLGFPVVTTVGNKGKGIDALLDGVIETIRSQHRRVKIVLGERLDTAVSAVNVLIEKDSLDKKDSGWLALRLIVDGQDQNLHEFENINQAALAEASVQRKRIETETGLDIQTAVTEAFFGFVDGLLKEVTLREIRKDARAVSDRIDHVLVHPALGLPFFALVMYGIFWTTFSLGEIPMGWIETGFSFLGDTVSGYFENSDSSSIRSLIVDGIIGGVGGVAVFLPNILLLFLGLALLEDTGYMARAAFLMDKVMHRFGLHGKSFLPLLTGFGCSIPGIMATRTLENEKDRLITMLVLPLMSCGARLPIWMLLIPAFFPPIWRAPMLFFIYALGVAAALSLALLLRKTLLKSEEAPFVMELPPYRLPTAKAVVFKMLERSGLYLKKAGTVILAVSILMWFAASYPKLSNAETLNLLEKAKESGLSEAEADARIAASELRHSIAGRIGGALETVLSPLGFDWKISCAMVGAFAAKEVFVAQMGVVFSMGETDETSVPLREAIAREYSPLAGLSMILFLLIGTPCMATVAVVRRESGAGKWAAFQFFGLTGLAWVVSFLVFQIGSIVGIG